MGGRGNASMRGIRFIDRCVSKIYPCHMAPTQFSDPRRQRLRFRPLKAMAHFRALIKDKEDTEQVFHIFECLPRRSFWTDAKAFCESARGRALMESEPYLPTILDDHDALLKLPEGSVAHAYVHFMRREGLSAAGLVAESEKMRVGRPVFQDQIQWYGNRLRDTHDLLHILTGYGRDALGEQCALGFTYGQDRAWGSLLIAWAGAYELKRRFGTDAPVYGAVAQAQRHGKAAQKIYEQDIRALLAEPLEAARKRLNIGDPDCYRTAHQCYRARGIDPYNFLAAPAAA
jgi:ubiquinone biosynthesis protein COQ4